VGGGADRTGVGTDDVGGGASEPHASAAAIASEPASDAVRMRDERRGDRERCQRRAARGSWPGGLSFFCGER
jgi:hypothetical protein